jgi:GNAT superfamily N-acetyltransferase
MPEPVITTYLELRDPAEVRAKPLTDPRVRILEATTRQWKLNRFLYDLVGSAWSWTDKAAWSDAQWQAYAEAGSLQTFVCYVEGSPAGYFELHRADGDIEIAYFGLAPAFIGSGLGGPLLTVALETALAQRPGRVWVHTCSRDHPAALANYQARGMRVYRVE